MQYGLSFDRIRYYIVPNGKAPFIDWLNSIKDVTIRTKIERRIERLELGNYGDCKQLGNSVSELRLAFGSGYRVYYGEVDNVIVVLLCGGNKATQKKDIAKAKCYWQAFKGEY